MTVEAWGRWVCDPGGITRQVKNLAGDPFVVGDTYHCNLCGRKMTVDKVEPDGFSFIQPYHRFLTKAEKRAMRRGQ